jgi:sulfur-oxidizing protein SoxZ
MANVRIDVPRSAKRGEIIDIRALVQHHMETGFRRTQHGKPIPRNIVTTFVCTYDGVEVFRAELYPSISANPFIQFSTVATETGTLEFRWSGDNGFTASSTARIVVT